MLLALPALPLVVPLGGHQTLDVDKGDLAPVAGQIEAMLMSGHVEAIVVEHGPFYPRMDKSAAANAAMAAAHGIASRLHERILTLCADLLLPCHTIARNTWAHRVVPHHQGGVSNEEGNAALSGRVDPETWARLADQDQRDAAGALVGHLLGGATVGPRPARRRLGPIRDRRKDQSTPNIRTLPPEEQARIRADRKAAAKVKDKVRFQLAAGPDAPARLARAATDCTCGPNGTPRPTSATGRHRRECPVAPAPKPSKSATAHQ